MNDQVQSAYRDWLLGYYTPESQAHSRKRLRQQRCFHRVIKMHNPYQCVDCGMDVTEMSKIERVMSGAARC